MGSIDAPIPMSYVDTPYKHPDVQGAWSIQMCGGIQTYMGVSKHMGAYECMCMYRQPLSLTTTHACL